MVFKDELYWFNLTSKNIAKVKLGRDNEFANIHMEIS